MNPSITRAQSMQLKGIAILMMLFLHLFNTQDRVAECTTFINFINGKPLVYALSRIAGLCVPIYLFISGYGFSLSHDFSPSKQWSRFYQLYGRFLLAFATFIGLGVMLKPDRYIGSAAEFLLNLSTLSCSYNGEWWFLFPYLVIMLSARWTTAFVKRNSFKTNVTLFFILLALSISCYTWMPKTFGEPLPLTIFYNLGKTLPAFHVGCVVATFPQHFLRRYPFAPRTILGLLLLLCLLRMCVGTSRINVLFAVPAILLIVQLRLPQWLSATLETFGHYSVFMWLTHTFFAYYLFHDWIYGMHYPPVMYAVLIAVSCVTSILLERLACALLR